MLTYWRHARNVSLFLIDEPDIYFHADLQRQLLGILRELGPAILMATHSTEILTEVDTDEVVLVDKQRGRAARLKNTVQLESVFRSLGSASNPILTQLAKTRKVVFVEGTDFHLRGRFARRLGRQRLRGSTDARPLAIMLRARVSTACASGPITLSTRRRRSPEYASQSCF